MDIKLKNRLKIVWMLVILVIFSYGFGSALYSLNTIPRDLEGDYFQTYEFASTLEGFLDLFATAQLDYEDLDTAKENIQVSQEEIEGLRDTYQIQMENELSSLGSEEKTVDSAPLDTQSNEAVAEQTDEGEPVQVTEEETIQTERPVDQSDQQTDQIEKIKQKYTKTDEELEEIIRKQKGKALEEEYAGVQDQVSRFEYMENYIYYYITDSTGKVYTNIEDQKTNTTDENTNSESEEVQVDKKAVKANSEYFQVFPYHTKVHDNLTGANHFFITRELSGFIAIPKETEAYSLILENMYDYQDQRVEHFRQLGIRLGILILGSFLLWKYRRRMKKYIQPLKGLHNWFPIDVRMLCLLFAGLTVLSSGDVVVYGHWDSILFYCILLTACIVEGIFIYPELMSKDIFKEKWKQSLLKKMKKGFENSFVYKSPVFMILVILSIVFVFGAGAAAVLIEPGVIVVYGPMALIAATIVLMYTFRKLGYFNSILKASDDIIKGTMVSDLPVKGKGPLSELAVNMNQVRQGVHQSRQVEAKSERLKTELISNVSHDLRTPLTSIMNYTEFLKKKDISEEERENYIEIIDRKSQRLKVLIDDLFEVSKMASGNIELVLEEADIVQLIHQALGEYDEKIKESSLIFKVNFSSPHIYATVDGRKMWRVFENIISNILKYSMENTRVYINTEETNTEVIVSFKNISNYELGDNIDELINRFKRGDQSRHTEGSGLGLAIAKSIVDHHGGRLDIEVDGDLFKSIVRIKK